MLDSTWSSVLHESIPESMILLFLLRMYLFSFSILRFGKPRIRILAILLRVVLSRLSYFGRNVFKIESFPKIFFIKIDDDEIKQNADNKFVVNESGPVSVKPLR
jgi:hypothetical protein